MKLLAKLLRILRRVNPILDKTEELGTVLQGEGVDDRPVNPVGPANCGGDPGVVGHGGDSKPVNPVP